MTTKSDTATPPLPYGRHWINDEDVAAVAATLRGDWLTQGPTIEAFEHALAEFCGARYAVVVTSGTAALHVACLAAEISKGDVGITSPISFVASANGVAYCGGTPAFCDVDPATITMDASALEAACARQKPKVVIPVDFSGQPADLPAIQEIARRCNALVIEDAAHSLGATYHHRGRQYRAGSCEHTDMAVLSFHPVKHVTTAEGGAILTNDAGLYRALSTLRTHGITKDPQHLHENHGPWYYEQQALGFNYRMTDVQAALGLSQMQRLPEFVARRRALVEHYVAALGDELRDDVQLLTESDGRRSSYHLMVARLRGGRPVRRAVFDALQADRIRAQVHYIPIHLQPWYRQHYGFHENDFPNAERYYDGCISLPLFPQMLDSDVDRVVESLRRALAAASASRGGTQNDIRTSARS